MQGKRKVDSQCGREVRRQAGLRGVRQLAKEGSQASMEEGDGLGSLVRKRCKQKGKEGRADEWRMLQDC